MPGAANPSTEQSRLGRLFAYAAIYFLWGASFLAIRVIVASVPPLLAAGFRFLSAGLILFAWSMLRGGAFPKLREWRSAVLLGVVMFACNYGPLFWAEQRVPSGVAAILSALIPVWIAAFEWSRSGSRMPVRLIAGTVCGLSGVAALSLTPGHISSQRIDLAAVLALLMGTVAWSVGTIWSRNLPLPKSKPVSSGIQMMLGGLTLTAASFAFGDARGFSASALNFHIIGSMVYLIVGASIIAFTAYVWLLGHEPATRVASYAYVNPVVAVLLGWSLGGEKLSMQVVTGMAFVLVGVIAVLGQQMRPETPSQILSSNCDDELAIDRRA
jgi:drug/metabolite transporter (DMT)-like permease